MEVREVVRKLRRMGAFCQKQRGEDRYTCQLEGMKIKVTPEKIIVDVPADIRNVRFYFKEFQLSEDVFEEGVKNFAGARSAGLIFPEEGSLSIVFDIGDAPRALKVIKKIKDEDLWLVFDDVDVNVRCRVGDEEVDCWEWIGRLEE